MIPLSPICISACLQALPSLPIREFLDWEQQSSLPAKSEIRAPKLLASVPDSSPQVCECDVCEHLHVYDFVPLSLWINLPCKSVSLFLSFLQSKPSLCFFHLTHSSPSFIPLLLTPIFISCLMSHTPLSNLPFCLFSFNLFAPSLSTPSSLLWSDHKANLIKRTFIRPLSFFPGVLSCKHARACVRACEQGIFVSNRSLWQGIQPARADVQTISTLEISDSRQQWCCRLRGNDIFAV